MNLTQDLMIEIIMRIIMITFYPIYLTIMFIDIIFFGLEYNLSDFKKVIVFPFVKW